MEGDLSLALYVPGLHKGYIRFFERYASRKPKLYLFGRQLQELQPLVAREIRAITAETMQRLLSGLGYFSSVEVATPEVLQGLRGHVVTSSEDLSLLVAGLYLGNATVSHESVFLRWDANTVKQLIVPPIHTGEITSEELHREMMALAVQEAQKSSDWFRQVGALLFKDAEHQYLIGYNRRQPSSHEALLVGDPRSYIDYGTQTETRTVIHAEQSVIAQAARQGIATEGMHLYVTTFPCPDCSYLIAEAGIDTVFFKDGYANLGNDQFLISRGIRVVKVI